MPETTDSIDALLNGRPVKPRGLYIHVPFCFHKCHYCDFYSIVDSHDRQSLFVDRLIDELAASATYLVAPIETIFIGGGTPSLLTARQWGRLFGAFHETLVLAPDFEFTVEVNPETVTTELASCLKSGGVNRVSIGAQSFHAHLLDALERQHNPANVARSINDVRSAGIENINLDLIFAIPGQSLDEWKKDLENALKLAPDHLSCYGLMYEPNTPLTQRLRRGEVRRADEDLEAAMYEEALDRLEADGFKHYEISNWSRPCRQCRHNLLYWTNADWWPLGPSASGHGGGVRWKNRPRLGEYLSTGGLPPVQDIELLDAAERFGEALMLRLRLREGVPTRWFENQASPGAIEPPRRKSLARFIEQGLLEQTQSHVRLTRAGLLLADTVLSELL